MTTLIAPALPDPESPPPLLTAEDFFRRHEKHRVELVRGVVKELPMPGGRHGDVGGRIAGLLFVHLMTNDVGRVLINDTFVITGRNPDSMRGMDVAYISYARMPKGPAPDGPLTVAPELVVEVRSPSDAWTEVFAKVDEYLGAGVTVVAVLDPASATASTYRPGAVQQTFAVGDTLTVPDVLPGFAVAVERLFG